MRERQAEIKQLKTELNEKEEMIQTQQTQIEMLRKQVIMMKANMNGRNQSSTKLDITNDTETQTSPSLCNGRRSLSSHSTASSRGSRKRQGACCTIM